MGKISVVDLAQMKMETKTTLGNEWFLGRRDLAGRLMWKGRGKEFVGKVEMEGGREGGREGGKVNG